MSVIDQMFALTLGRPLGDEDSYCDVELPVNLKVSAFHNASVVPK